MTEPIIRAQAVEKFYLQPDGNRIEVIAPVDLDVEPGKIITLLGPSGCGKSTLLRILTGLSKPSSGEVLWHGKPITSQNAGVAIVFQSFALFPWLTVLDNVEAPLEARGVPAMERHKRALRILDTVGLDGFESAYPKELSGGMKQRVGFARALVVEPEVLFMDEPFSALDVLTAENLRNELLELWLSKKMPTSAIFIVTHNIEEAVLLADRVIVLAQKSGVGARRFSHRTPASPRSQIAALCRTGRLHLQNHDPARNSRWPCRAPAAAAQKPARQKYQMIPHARVGGIAGLLELLQDRGGKEYLHRLAEDPDHGCRRSAAHRRGGGAARFRHVERRRRSKLPPEGARFAEADILTRKILFRQAALKHVVILQQIDSVLHAKADHSISEEFFYDILDEHFSQDEVERQFETAMNWGRYAEIFDFDRESHRLVLAEPVGEPHPPTSTPVQS